MNKETELLAKALDALNDFDYEKRINIINEIKNHLSVKNSGFNYFNYEEIMKLADNYAHHYAFVDDDSMPRTREALSDYLTKLCSQTGKP